MATITKQGQKGNLTILDLDYEGTKDGEDQVKNYLEIVQQKLGFIPNVLAAFAKFPKQFEGFTKLYNALMLGESGLTKLEREMIAVTVSSENHCFYCLVAHGSAVRELSNDPQLGERIAANFRSAELPKKQEELLNFTKKLSEDLASTEILGIAYCIGSINLKPFRLTKSKDFVSTYVLNLVAAADIIREFQSNLTLNNGSVVLFSTVICACSKTDQ